MGFNLDRRMYDLLRCMPTIPGASAPSAARRCDRVGGMSDDTLAEDTDITMALHRAGWRVVYAENARAWTEAPATVAAAVVAALPLELRHHAGDVEAPPARSSNGAPPAASAASACRCRPLPGRRPAARAR